MKVGYGGQLKNGQYLSDVISDAGTHGTSENGNRLYLALNNNAVVFSNNFDVDVEGTQSAVAGIKYGYVFGTDNLLTAPTHATGEYLALIEMIGNEPRIIDSMYGSKDGAWQKINSVTLDSNNRIVLDVIEKVNYSDSTGEHIVRRIYRLSVVASKFNIIDVKS